MVNLTNVAYNLRHLGKSFTETTSRPSVMQPYMATDTGAKLPIFPYPLIMIYELADNVDALRIPIETLNREMFKNGFEVVEKFKYKCTNCEKEFKYKPTKGGSKDNSPDSHTLSSDKKIDNDRNLACDECDSTKLVRPKPENRKILQKLFTEPINNNRQTIMDVSRMLERDLEIADGAYMLVLKSYNIDDRTGKIDHKKSIIKEILRVDPPQAAIIADSDGRIGYDDKRNPVYVCPFFEHRDKRLTQDKCIRTTDGYHSVPVQALKATHEVSSVYSIGIPQPKRVIYADGEIIWKAGKYRPGLIYGMSPIYAIWSKVMALSHMDEYIRKYFDKMRPPRGLLVVASRNYETFKKAWNALEEKATEDPYMIHPLMVESEKGGRNMAQWLDFTGSLKELQFLEMRKELRQIIGAIYGVLPLYFGELPSGWSNEGLQVTITNRAVKWGQDVMFESFFDILAKMMGVDDWDLKLKAGEEADRLRELEIEAQEIQNNASLQTMGFPVERTHQGQWKVGKYPTFEQTPMEGMGRGDSLTGDKERTPKSEGSPMRQRPSDAGSAGQGHPSPGGKRSGAFNQSQKAHSFEFWHSRMIDDGWGSTAAAEEILRWKTTTNKSGTLYIPNQVESEHPADFKDDVPKPEKPHLMGKEPQITEEESKRS